MTKKKPLPPPKRKPKEVRQVIKPKPVAHVIAEIPPEHIPVLAEVVKEEPAVVVVVPKTLWERIQEWMHQ